MTRTANPIEAMIAAESSYESPVLEAMLRRFDEADNLACLVVMQAFVPPLYRAAIALRFSVRDDLEECATRVLAGFCSVVWSREDGPVPGSVLVARARCEADHAIELKRRFAILALPDSRIARLRCYLEEEASRPTLVADLVRVVIREWVRQHRAKTDATKRWEVLSGALCRDGEPTLPPAGYPLIETERAWGLWGPRAVSDGDAQRYAPAEATPGQERLSTAPGG
jgi:hypothetical protein